MLGIYRETTIVPPQPEDRVEAPALPQGTLKVETVPEAQKPQKEPIIRIIMPIVMVTAMVAMVLIMALSGQGMSPMMMLMPLMMGMSMVMMIAPPERTGDIDEQRRVYLRHLDALGEQALKNAEAQRAHEQFRHPDPKTLVNGTDPARLWERGSSDPHALEVRLGLGVASLCTPVEVDDPGSTEDLDPVCAVILRRTVAAISAVHSIPIVLQLRAFRLITLSGEKAESTAAAILSQLIFFHGPETVSVDNRCAAKSFQWLKWSIHSRDPEQAECRIIVVDTHSPDLTDVVLRADSSLSEGSNAFVCVIVVAEDADDPVHRFSDDDGIHLHIGEDAVEVRTVVGPERLGAPDDFGHQDAELVARALAAFRRPAGGRAETHSDLMSLLELPAIDQIREHELWPGRFGTRGQLTVPIGVDERGFPVQLDLKEAAHGGMGPHGLCIGATGSGKSELLKSLVVALAVSHSPDELNFVLVDFKGGATFLGCEELPHTSAVITNLDNEAILVERMFDAISGELNRRQELLRHAGNFANVTEYTQARLGTRPDLAPLPSLMIVVDEFSELLGQHPDFAELFVAVGRLGRSLGVHLLLASQRLEEGKLRGLDSHLSYRIGLKTFSAAESRQVLGVTDAYQLPSQPGAGYLKRHSDQLTRFQGAYVSGALEKRELTDAPLEVASVQLYHDWSTLDAGGARSTETTVTVDETTTLLREVVALASRVAALREQRAHQVWLPPLPKEIEISRVCEDKGTMRCAIGIVDQPYHQRQDDLVLDLNQSGGHVAIAGGPQTGKSTALRTIIASLAATHSTADLAFYIVDAGNGDYRDLERLPHLAGFATKNQPEKLRRIIDEVAGFLTDPPPRRIVLVLDGWHALVGADQEFDDIKNQVGAIASDGPAAGVHLVIATQRWSAIRAVIRDLIGTRLELRLGEAMDSVIDRKLQNKLPSAPGRGLDSQGRFMLIARTAKQDVAHIAAQAQRAGYEPVPQLKMLPSHIDLAQLAGTHTIPLGVGGPHLAPVGLESSHFLVTGTQGSGKSTVLASLMHSIASLPREEARLVIVDPRRHHLGAIDDSMVASYAPTTDAAGKAINSTVATLRARLPHPNVTPEEIAARSWWQGPDIYLVIDDFDLLPEDHLRALIELLPHSGDIGLHIYVGRKFGGISRALMGRFLSALRDQQPTVFIMDAHREEGAVFGVRPGSQPPGRGTLITSGEVFGTVHVASAEPASVDATGEVQP
ncbi:type VII secretion protein EccCa [Corynebacterium lubricantis]|uniref:type VII secretion protein EccCa n=1 Tax=Corynebacterium lubricantis TaxID=541095 RepID=UPI00039DF111|nr:type VII secretion protein EccCa [Corynebacterium lubricantis]